MLALTMGDPAGIGGEIAAKAWTALRGGGPRFVALDDAARLAGYGVPIREVGSAAEAEGVFAEALPVLPVALGAAVVPGRPDVRNAAAVIASIERAVKLVQGGRRGRW